MPTNACQERWALHSTKQIPCLHSPNVDKGCSCPWRPEVSFCVLSIREPKTNKAYGHVCYSNIVSVVNSIRFNENEIREFKGYENLTDEQARDVADFLAMWSIIVFDGMKRYGRD